MELNSLVTRVPSYDFISWANEGFFPDSFYTFVTNNIQEEWKFTDTNLSVEKRFIGFHIEHSNMQDTVPDLYGCLIHS